MQQITIHFDVEDHFLRLDTFFRSAVAAQQAVEAINNACFDGFAPFELVIVPPDEGSLKQYIGVLLKSSTITYFAFWALVQAMDSATVQEVSKELFGATPTELLVAKIRNIKKHHSDGQFNLSQPKDDLEAVVLIENFVTRSAQRALEIQPLELAAAEVSETLKYEIGVAQSELFDAALNNPSVLGIGFDATDDFPIPRSQFPERAVKPRKPEIEDEVDEIWLTSVRTVQVTSPNFVKEDQSYRKWKGRDIGGGFILFEIRDEQFWLKFRLHEFDFSESTVLKVHLASRLVDGRVRENIVVRVLEVDGLKLAEPLSSDALNAILGSYQELNDVKDQWSLFDIDN